ncbi:MAG: hypothetical protein ACLFMX_03850 [Halobacteriales archaeon]
MSGSDASDSPLERLVGRYVASTDDGYELRRVGYSVVQTALAGTGIEDAHRDATRVDMPSPYCGATTAVGYKDQHRYHVCFECVGGRGDAGKGWSVHVGGADGSLIGLFQFDPNGVCDRTTQELLDAAIIKPLTSITSAVGGVCPACSGRLHDHLDVFDDHDATEEPVCTACDRRSPVRAVYRCATGKVQFGFPPRGRS